MCNWPLKKALVETCIGKTLLCSALGALGASTCFPVGLRNNGRTASCRHLRLCVPGLHPDHPPCTSPTSCQSHRPLLSGEVTRLPLQPGLLVSAILRPPAGCQSSPGECPSGSLFLPCDHTSCPEHGFYLLHCSPPEGSP